MAQHLDLEEQEQLDQLKHYWNQYGNLVTWILIVILGAFAAWNGYQYWQRNQAAKAAALYDEVERAAGAKDLTRLDRSLGDMKDKFGGTDYAQQSALLAAKVYAENDKSDAARAALTWVAEKSDSKGYQAIARLRLAALLADAKSYDEALKQLAGEFPVEFASLVSDRRGDILALQGKPAQAKDEYLKAYRELPASENYRRLIEYKLNSLGVDPQTDTAVAAPGAK